MRLSVAIFACFSGLLTACAGGSSAPADGAPASTTPASTAAAPAATTAPTAAALAETAATNPTPAAADSSLCVLGKSGTWATCIGKLVEMRGKDPQLVMQHPMLGGGPPGAVTMQQTYLETAEGNQIIILSKTAPKCPGAQKRVKGTLRDVNLGGPEGTKESYRGWSIHDATITCE